MDLGQWLTFWFNNWCHFLHPHLIWVICCLILRHQLNQWQLINDKTQPVEQSYEILTNICTCFQHVAICFILKWLHYRFRDSLLTNVHFGFDIKWSEVTEDIHTGDEWHVHTDVAVENGIYNFGLLIFDSANLLAGPHYLHHHSFLRFFGCFLNFWWVSLAQIVYFDSYLVSLLAAWKVHTGSRETVQN